VSHDDEFGFAFLDEGGNVVETEFKMHWLWTSVSSGSLSFSGFSLVGESVLLLLSSLWGVLGEELEELRSLVLVNSLLELVEGWW